MMSRFSLLAIPLLLAGCGEKSGDGGNVAAAAPVAAAPAPAGQNWVDTVAQTPEGGWRMGNPNAPIKLVEYGSRTCHVCRDFDTEGFAPLTSKYVASGKVSYEFRDFLRNGADMAAALVGQCGGGGPYFAILNQMYAVQPETLAKAEALPQTFYSQLGSLPPTQQPARYAEALGFIDFVKQRGIPEAKARQCLADGATAEALTRMNEAAVAEYELPGTPTFILNGKRIEDTVNWQQVETALKAAGA